MHLRQHVAIGDLRAADRDRRAPPRPHRRAIAGGLRLGVGAARVERRGRAGRRRRASAERDDIRNVGRFGRAEQPHFRRGQEVRQQERAGAGEKERPLGFAKLDRQIVRPDGGGLPQQLPRGQILDARVDLAAPGVERRHQRAGAVAPRHRNAKCRRGCRRRRPESRAPAPGRAPRRRRRGPGEGARAGGHRDPTEVAERDSGFAEHGLDHRHQPLGMAAADPFSRSGEDFRRFPASPRDGYRAIGPGGIEGKQKHADRLAKRPGAVEAGRQPGSSDEAHDATFSLRPSARTTFTIVANSGLPSGESAL